MRNILFWAVIIGFFVFCFASFKHVDNTRESSARDKIKGINVENEVLSYSLNKLKPTIKNEALFLAEVSKKFNNHEASKIAKILGISVEEEKSEENLSVVE